MEKKLFVLLAAFLAVAVAFSSCCHSGDHGSGTPTDSFSTFIPKDSANKMISSYLGSINYPGNDSDLRSIIIDVKQLADYMKEASSAGKCTKIKLMFAHTLKYINNGGKDQNCGYQSGKLTLVLALYDSAGNYIYKNGNCVLDNMQPCPAYCPVTGTAAQNTFP